MARRKRRRPKVAGAAPGTLSVAEDASKTSLRAFCYSGAELEDHAALTLDGLKQRLDRGLSTWIDVEGFADTDLLGGLRDTLRLHPLALEDATSDQRPKADRHDSHDFIVLRMARVENSQLQLEQVAVFFSDRFVLTLQEGLPGDVLEPVRNRLRQASGRIRDRGARYLAYAVVDSVVDHYFPVVDTFAETLDKLEAEALEATDRDVPVRLVQIKRELALLHRTIRPLRDALSVMFRDGRVDQPEELQPFIHDCHDHVVQVLDLIDEQRDQATALMDIYLSRTGNRMNEVMRTLTVMSVFFMPLTFIAGVYGMNFDRGKPWNMPELGWDYGYLFALALMLLSSVGLLVWISRRGWLRS